MKHVIEKLINFGLNEKEAKIYLASLELGEANIQRIAQKAKISRTTAYDIINSLIKKGFLAKTSNRKRYRYYAQDPRRLEDKLNEQKTAIRSILPEMLAMANLIDNKPQIRFFEGMEGIKEVYLDTLKYPRKPLFAWLTDRTIAHLDQNFIDFYLASRVKKQVPAYVIAPDSEVLREYKYQEDDHKFLRKTIYEKPENFMTLVEINLYGDQSIGIMSFDEQFGLVIESKKIWLSLKSIFDRHWIAIGGESF